MLRALMKPFFMPHVLVGVLAPSIRHQAQLLTRLQSLVTQGFEGSIAQYLGDGLLVYFGYPQAHEDDSQPAVRAALGMVQAMGPLNQHLEQAKGVRRKLSLRHCRDARPASPAVYPQAAGAASRAHP